ncbi:phage tail tape measure protein [Paraburkholderia mimosarum]|uniref:phage tail tape measure protein n=1 Tax=Paraburkholderia mimosarum TaxID=312026 RepID=UPI0039C4BB91
MRQRLTNSVSAIENTRKALKAQGDEAVSAFNKSSKTAESWLTSLQKQADQAGKTKAQLMELRAAELGVSDAAQPYIDKIKAAEAAMNSGGHAAHSFSMANAGARRELLVLAHELSQGNFKRFGGSLLVLAERTDAMSLIMNKTVLSIGAVAAVVAVAAEVTIRAAEDLAKYGHQVATISQQTGLSTAEVQKWGFAAAASGIDAKEATKGIADFGEAQNKAAHGNKDAIAAFSAVGISLKSIKDSSPTELLYQVADAFSVSADGAGKAAVAHELFGAAGDALIPVLNKGSSGLRELGVQAEASGAVIKDSLIKQMDALAEHFEMSKAKMDAMNRDAKTELLPTIVAITEAFGDNASMGPTLHEFYSDVAAVAKAAAIGLAAIVTAAKEAGAGISMMANIANQAGAGSVQGVVDAWKNGIKEIGDAQKNYDDFVNRVLAGPKETAGPPRSAMSRGQINFSKGEHTSHEKAYHDDAAERFLQQIRDQAAELRTQLSTTDKLTEAQKELVKFNQQIADWKGKTLTADQKSLIAHQDEIRAQLQTNIELEKEVKHREDVAKLTERSAQINASIASYQTGQQAQYARQLDAFGMGSEAQKNVQAVKSIYAEYQRLQEQLDKATPKELIGGADYLKATADIKAGLDQSLKDYDDYYAALKQKQGDWANGASAAFANYIDSAQNVAGETQAAFTKVFTGMEDALAQFATTGKLNFTKLADGILVDLNRMASHQLLGGLFQNLSNIGGSVAGGLFASHPDAAATTASALPGNALDNMMKLTKGFGTMNGGPMNVANLQAAVQNASSLTAINAMVTTMTVGAMIGAGGVGGGSGGGGIGDMLGGLLGSMGGGDMAGAFGFTATGVTGSAGAVAAGAAADSSTTGMTALMGLGGMLATGGPTDPGVPYLVGEKGPELFVPSQSGRVVPNHALTINDGGSSPKGGQGMSQMFNMDITVPPGTTSATAQQQARAIMERAQIAMRRNS